MKSVHGLLVAFGLATGGCGVGCVSGVLATAEYRHRDIDPAFYPYYQSFLIEYPEAKSSRYLLTGITTVADGDMPESATPGVRTLGVCYSDEERQFSRYIIVTDRVAEPWEVRWVVFHELGHCLLDRVHAPEDQPLNLMVPFIPAREFVEANWETIKRSLH